MAAPGEPGKMGGVDPRLERARINASWILKLRWAAAAGQSATILFVQTGLGVALPVVALAAVLGIELVTNLALVRWLRSRPRGGGEGEVAVLERTLGGVMLLDLVLLTVLLFLTGGPTNPFIVFYLVNIVLSAVVLPPFWTWGVTSLGLFCYGLLFFAHLPLPELEAMGYSPGEDLASGERLSLYLRGLLVAFAMAAVVIVVFVTRLSAAVARQERELDVRRRMLARAERLQALGTLAAGAAHELATPLSTIAVVAKDLEKALERGAVGPETKEDARLIRSEVARCRTILDQMALEGGSSRGEDTRPVEPAVLVADACLGLKGVERVEVTIEEGLPLLKVPRKALALALRQVVKNALDASPPDYHVTVHVRREGDALVLRVRDQGAGMDEPTRARATDPFFTTKEPGQGMGLGLFLTQTVVERLSGTFELDSRPARGTEAVVRLPLAGIVAPATASAAR